MVPDYSIMPPLEDVEKALCDPEGRNRQFGFIRVVASRPCPDLCRSCEQLFAAAAKARDCSQS